MRILFATDHQHLPDRVGGSEVSIHETSLELAAQGIEVAVLASSIGPNQRNRWGRLLPGIRLRTDSELGYPTHRHAWPERCARTLLKRFDPDAVIVQTGASMRIAGAFLRAGARVALHLRDVQFHRLGAPVKAHRRLRFLANSQFTAGRFREAYGIEAAVVPPCVVPTRYRGSGPHDRVLFVNPVPVKGLELALELARARPDVGFDFVEGWPVFHALRSRRDAALAELPNVTLHPSTFEMAPHYARARALLVPSMDEHGRWEEGFGRVAAEAQCGGVPVLASSSGALPETIGPGGIALPAGATLDDWCRALSDVWDDPARYAELSAAARRHADRPEIQPAAVVARLLAEIERIAG